MLQRRYLRCRICNQLLVLREQSSTIRDPFEFSFYCGNCFSKFDAIRDVKGIIFKGTDEIIEELNWDPEESKKHDESAFVFEISWDFPIENGYWIEHQNNPLNWIHSHLSPYMRIAPELLGEDEEAGKRKLWYGNYIANKENYYFYEKFEDPNMKHEYDDSLVKIVKNKYPEIVKVIDTLSRIINVPQDKVELWKNATAFNYLITEEISTMFDFKEDVLGSLTRVDKELNKIFKDDVDRRKNIIKFLNKNSYIKILKHRDEEALKLINKNRQKFLPVLIAKYTKENKDTVSTFTINELMAIYASLFELILGNFDILVIISNIANRNDPTKFKQDSMSFSDNRLKRKDGIMMNGAKIDFIKNQFSESTLSWIFNMKIIDNKIRNGINHEDYSYDPVNQLLKIAKNKTYSLLEFAFLDLEMIKIAALMHQVIWYFKRLILIEQ